MLSEINYLNEQVIALPFLLDCYGIDYHHSFTKDAQDNWDEFIPDLPQHFHYISHEPVYLSRMLHLKESEFTRRAGRVR